MSLKLTRSRLPIWQGLFILLGTTWLLAPGLNGMLSDRTALISQYESAGQPYALVFRLGDLLAGTLLIWLVLSFFRHKLKTLPVLLLLIIGAGMVFDPVFTTTCSVHGSVCQETFSFSFLLHAIESVVTAFSFALLALYDAKVRHKLTSIGFLIFQLGYGLLFLTEYADQQHFNTASQYVYQCVLVVWLAWFVRDYLFGETNLHLNRKRAVVVRRTAAFWMLLNGLLAILLSLRDIHLIGQFKQLYFARDTAWLAQHGMIVGVIMLYLSRHLLRGERRARQLLLLIMGFEVLKYAVITPSWPFVIVYSVTFVLLFVLVDDFQRGSLALTWRVRFKDLAYLLTALSVVALITLLILSSNNRLARTADRSFRRFTYYAVHSDKITHGRKESVLLANATTAFVVAGLGAILWTLFKPYGLPLKQPADLEQLNDLLERYADTSEDYFKLWPTKQYFWYGAQRGFIAYKIVGSVAFALADPISPPGIRARLVRQFTAWASQRRLKVCFLPITHRSLRLYKDLTPMQIGASALIDTDTFLSKTVKNKWWRWKQNRATKHGYQYSVNQPPHAATFLAELEQLSDAWLAGGHHQERGFALGYFDHEYLQQCTIYCLKDQAGKLVAFANQLPTFGQQNTATVDLMRYEPEAVDAMPYLLAQVIGTVHKAGHTYFDLGFIPFTDTKGPLLTIARALSGSRFSAKGLEQFKSKFEPEWQKIYLAYDGDLGDLAVIALSIEPAMRKDK